MSRASKVSIRLIPTVLIALGLQIGSSVAQADEQQNVSVRFKAVVGSKPFSCNQALTGLKGGGAKVVVEDFRFYISDVALVDESGKDVPIELTQDGKWQYQNLALIDFEDKTGTCTNGTSQTNTMVVGTVPKGKYNGLRFTLGVPFKLNHEDSTLQPSPLNLTALWWNWQFGHKFLRLDLNTTSGMKGKIAGMAGMEGMSGMAGMTHMAKTTNQGFPIHLGSTGCRTEKGAQKPTECLYPNTVRIEFKQFDPANETVVADVAALLAGIDVSKNRPQTTPGCMSEPEDGDCSALMDHLGIGFGGKSPNPQAFFRVEH